MLAPLTSLYNSRIRERNFPTTFKIHVVLTIFKKGDIEKIDNLRPIAIIPIFAKSFEIILKFRLDVYL